jgi:multiple antibiotic resistance protein
MSLLSAAVLLFFVGIRSATCRCFSPRAVILYFAGNLRKLLGDRGLTAVERLMGMLLVVVAVEMLMRGAAEYLH